MAPGIANIHSEVRNHMETSRGGNPVDRSLRSKNSHRAGSGLSKSHISTKPFNKESFKEIAQEMQKKPIYGNGTHWIKLYKGGRLAEVKIHSGGCVSEFNEEDNKPYKAIRGKITKWSRKSQMRFKQALAKLDQSKLEYGLEITLTYPKDFPPPDDHETYKKHLAYMNVWLRRRGICGAWKLEFQSRGAAHYHILALPEKKYEGLSELRKEVAEQWYRVVGSGDERHLRAGTEVSPIKSTAGIIGYMASYMAKKDQTLPDNFTGRYWGFIGKVDLPFVEPKVIPLGRENAAKIRRLARQKIQRDMRNYQLRIIAAQLEKDSGLKYSAQEILNGFFRLEAKTKKDRQLKDLISRGWVKHPKKWRLRNNRVTRLFCDPNALEKALICLFRREKRSLQNEGFLP